MKPYKTTPEFQKKKVVKKMAVRRNCKEGSLAGMKMHDPATVIKMERLEQEKVDVKYGITADNRSLHLVHYESATSK